MQTAETQIGQRVEEDYISDKYSLLNNDTGEVIPITVFVKKGQKTWQKVYAKALADMLEISGDERTRVIAYLIRKKDYENRVAETGRSIAEATGVSLKTVQRTLTALQSKNYLHKVRNGLWRFSPHVMVTGRATLGAAVYAAWDNDGVLK